MKVTQAVLERKWYLGSPCICIPLMCLLYVFIGFTCFVVEIWIFDLKFASSVPVQSGGLSLSDH